MIHRVGLALVAAALLGTFLIAPAPAYAQSCSLNAGSRPPGWATDSHGKPLGACPQGTVCSNRGFCQRPLQ